MNIETRKLSFLGPARAVIAAMPVIALLLIAPPSHGQPVAGGAPQVEATCFEAVVATNTAAGKAAPAPTRVEPAVPNAATVTIPSGADSTLVADLKKGGYILFFRHAMTNWNERDVTEADFADRTLQRNLSEAGKTEAAEIGRAIAALRIPIERVLASPMWRTRDTARLAFGAYDTTGSLYWKGASFRETRIKILSTPPAAGKNLVLVGHQDQLIPIVPGLRRDQLKEGDALVFQPLGKGIYRVVTQVSPADWAKLACTPFTPLPPPPTQGSMPAVPPESAGGAKEPKTHN